MAKTVLITGASSGIGKATVEKFAREQWNVAATSRNIDNELFKSWPNVRPYKLDVTDTATIETTFQHVVKDFGAIDVVVNNAGYGLDGVFEAITDEQINKQFETNVFGLMSVTRQAIKIMRPQRKGVIIQVASMGGRLTFPLYSIYHSTKWAVEGFSESLHYELRQFGIKIKIVEPGVIKTAFYDRNRVFAKPDKKLGYENFLTKVEKVTHKAGSNGQSPDKVADKIYTAATTRSKKLRYAVGSPAPLLLALRKLLPDSVFMALVRWSYRI